MSCPNGCGHTPEQIIYGYLLSAVLLGAKFGDEPHPNYVKQTTQLAIRDLTSHGFAWIESAPLPEGAG